MPLIFSGSKELSLGVELEILLINPDTRKYCPMAVEVLKECDKRNIDHIKNELHLSLIEIDNEKHTSVKWVRDTLEEKLRQLRSITNSMNIELLMMGTHPFSLWHDNIIFPNPRYFEIADKLQWIAHRVNTNGTHLHVGVPNGDLALALTYESIPYLPHLIALAASSPFWQGHDTGVQSCRQSVMNNLVFCGIPPYFENWDEYSRYVDKMQATQTIVSPRDLHWQVRPNFQFGTVEFRIMDALPTLKETMAVVALIQNLTLSLMRRIKKAPTPPAILKERYWVALENQWEATRRGLDGMIIPEDNEQRVMIRRDIERLIEELTPTAHELNNYEEFIYLREILRDDNAASRQKLIFDKTESLLKVVDAMVWEFKTNTPLTHEKIMERNHLSFLRNDYKE